MNLPCFVVCSSLPHLSALRIYRKFWPCRRKTDVQAPECRRTQWHMKRQESKRGGLETQEGPQRATRPTGLGGGQMGLGGADHRHCPMPRAGAQGSGGPSPGCASPRAGGPSWSWKKAACSRFARKRAGRFSNQEPRDVMFGNKMRSASYILKASSYHLCDARNCGNQKIRSLSLQ